MLWAIYLEQFDDFAWNDTGKEKRGRLPVMEGAARSLPVHDRSIGDSRNEIGGRP